MASQAANAQRPNRTRSIVFILVYLAWLLVHALLEQTAICGEVSGFDGRHFSAVWAILWPPMLIVVLLLVVKGRELLTSIKALMSGALAVMSKPGLFAILSLVFVLAVSTYSIHRSIQRFTTVDALMQSDQWAELQNQHCS